MNATAWKYKGPSTQGAWWLTGDANFAGWAKQQKDYKVRELVESVVAHESANLIDKGACCQPVSHNVPAGFWLAPMEPDTDMIRAGLYFETDEGVRRFWNALRDHWLSRHPVRKVAARATEPTCLTCSDHGAVGLADRSEPCPECTPPGSLAEAQKAVAKYDDVLIPFLAMMRAELHSNAGKGDRPGWLTMDRDTAMLEVYHHAAKLAKALRNDNVPLICEHAADVANMAMMLVDVCGALPVATPPRAGSETTE